MFKKAVLAFVLTVPFTGMPAVAGSSSRPDTNSGPVISGEIPMPECGLSGCLPTPPTGK